MTDKKEAIVMEAQQARVRPHQPGQDVFRSVLSEDIEWKPFPAFPPSVRLAVVVGQPSEAGPYTISSTPINSRRIRPVGHRSARQYIPFSLGEIQ